MYLSHSEELTKYTGNEIYDIWRIDTSIISSTKIQPIIKCIQNFIANWKQHVGRMKGNIIAKQIIEYTPKEEKNPYEKQPKIIVKP